MVDRATELFDIDWTALSATKRTAKLKEIGKSLRGEFGEAGAKMLPGIKAAFEVHGDKIVEATRKRAVEKFELGIQATMTARDTKTAATLVAHSGLFVRNNYGEVAEKLSEKARKIVAAGVERGLGRDDIAEDLVKAMAAAKRPDSYWNLIATTFANRARNFTQVHAFDEAGIKSYFALAVIDEVTTDFCRYVDGMEFPVPGAVERVQRVLEGEPEDIIELMPWARNGKDSEGRDVIFYEQGGSRHRICVVEESAVGQRDKIGTYTHGLAPEALAAAGFTLPPWHGNCRTTIVASF